MGFFSKLKGAMNAVTGGAAKVTIEYPPNATLGQEIDVKITVTSTGSEVKSKGVFVDLRGYEEIVLRHREISDLDEDVVHSESTYDEEIQVTEAFVLGAEETKVVEGKLTIPESMLPSYSSKRVEHRVEIRGRLEAFGNDPDSGFLSIEVS